MRAPEGMAFSGCRGETMRGLNECVSCQRERPEVAAELFRSPLTLRMSQANGAGIVIACMPAWKFSFWEDATWLHRLTRPCGIRARVIAHAASPTAGSRAASSGVLRAPGACSRLTVARGVRGPCGHAEKRLRVARWWVTYPVTRACGCAARYDLGFFDHETCRIESAENPFAAKLLPMSPV